MSFANPWALVLFLPLAFAAWRLLRRGRNAGIRFSAIARSYSSLASAGVPAVV